MSGHLIYAGVGSRHLPEDAKIVLRLVGCCLALGGYQLYTGGASGADTAFEEGAIAALDLLKRHQQSTKELADLMQCFLPWPGFNHRPRNHPAYVFGNLKQAEKISRLHHPAWSSLSPTVRALMNRNTCQILGAELKSPVKMVIAYTPDGAISLAETTPDTGGTGQAIRIASAYQVPVFNISRPEHLNRISVWTDKIKMEWLQKYNVNLHELLAD